MNASDRYDVIVIGTGAGGGTLARALAPTGKRILLLERGDWLPRERDNWDSRAVFGDLKYRADETWRDQHGQSFEPGIHYYVGGNTKMFGGALFRLRREDFGEIRHHGGLSPAWPIEYEDLEPYYTEAEHLYHVHGRHGEDPTDPPASAEYRHPPVSHEPWVQQLHDKLVSAGHHPFHLPLAILLDEGNPHESRCIRCDRFDGFPCLLSAKGDAEVICVRPALEHANVTLLTHARVVRLETDASGREVTKVHVERAGAHEEYSADVVVVSCGAINSAVLLLRSANERHPNGLANRSDTVGRHYMRHNNAALLAISRDPNPTVFQKTLGLNDFYLGSDDWEYPLGHIQMLAKSDGEIMRAEAPGWVPWKPHGLFNMSAEHSVDFWLTTEDLPRPENRVTVDRDGAITLHLEPANTEAHRRLIAKLKSMLGAMNCHPLLFDRSLYAGKQIPISGTAHQCGTVRFGRDPETSALDVNCKAHDLDNLYVVDGSFFVTSAAVNPALTIAANALRIADRLCGRLGVTRPRLGP